MVPLFHGHGKEDALESRVNNGWGNLFDKRMEPMKMKYGQNSIGESCKGHSQGDTKICW